MPKRPTTPPKTTSAAPKNAKPPGDKLTTKHAKATAHKAPERRNENKVRGR